MRTAPPPTSTGVSDRKKLRYRYYDDLENGAPVFFEIKRKKDALVIKDRISLHLADCRNSELNSNLYKLKQAASDNSFLNEILFFIAEVFEFPTRSK